MTALAILPAVLGLLAAGFALAAVDMAGSETVSRAPPRKTSIAIFFSIFSPL